MGNQATNLRPDVLTDLENSTAFSAEEIREYYKEFMKDTSSGRMTLSKEEFKEAYSKVFPTGDATKFAEYAFLNFDKDGDGRIDFREFLMALSITQKGTVEEKLEWTFNMYDIDNSGTINKSELTKMISSIFAMRGKPQGVKVTVDQLVTYVMERADTNRDGSLTKEEFIQGARSNPVMQRMLVGTLQASGSPFTQRKATAAQ